MRRNTLLDPGSEIGIQQLVSLFLGQSTGDIRRKLQKLHPTEDRNLEVLLDEARRVFSNREEGCRQGQRIVTVIREEEGRRPRREWSRLGKDQYALCKRFGHWKRECPKNKEKGTRPPDRKNSPCKGRLTGTCGIHPSGSTGYNEAREGTIRGRIFG